MSSSWTLQQRKKMKDFWKISNFGDPKNALGGWEDHYIIPGHTRECHPDFEAVPIGNPYGFMVCRRKKFPNGQSISDGFPIFDGKQYEGYHKFQADLYDPRRKVQKQTYNPDIYYNRTIPEEDYYHANDYIAREFRYNGIGTDPMHTPGPRKYYEYGYSYTETPPLKYDVTRLQQPYPVWKDIQIYHGKTQKEMDRFDRVYNNVDTMGTM